MSGHSDRELCFNLPSNGCEFLEKRLVVHCSCMSARAYFELKTGQYAPANEIRRNFASVLDFGKLAWNPLDHFELKTGQYAPANQIRRNFASVLDFGKLA